MLQVIVDTKTLYGLKKQLKNHQRLSIQLSQFLTCKLLELGRYFGEIQNVFALFLLSPYSHTISRCQKLLS